jgi:hypothetical protein
LAFKGSWKDGKKEFEQIAGLVYHNLRATEDFAVRLGLAERFCL